LLSLVDIAGVSTGADLVPIPIKWLKAVSIEITSYGRRSGRALPARIGRSLPENIWLTILR
jgi:hypothetical protein